jgi:hypothetical protein
MNTPRDHRNLLEQRVDTLLRALPDQTAPAGLEARVLARLAAQQAVPVWRQGFSRWPLAARILFLLVAGACAWLALLLFARLAVGFESVRQLPIAQRAPSAWQALRSTGNSLWELLTRVVPLQWLYVGAVAAAVLYLMFFALGALAVRTLVLTPHHHRT